MRVNTHDLLVDDLKFDPLNYKAHDRFRESIGVLPNQHSRWILREFFDPCDFHQNRIYHDFFRLFSPDHVFTQYPVYEIREGRKIFLGFASNEVPGNGVQILNTRDVHVLFDQSIAEAISVLFFLNQSYSQLMNFFVDMADRYKIGQFDLKRLFSPLTEIQYYSFLTDADQGDKAVFQFMSRLAEYVSTDVHKFPIFFIKRELLLLHIVISPDFDQLFDFSGCPDLKENLSLRKEQLREILLTSDRFAEVIFQLSTADFQNNLNDFLCCLKKYDENNFSRYGDIVIKNYIHFFCDFLRIKFELILSELQREVSSVIFDEKEAGTQRIYNVLMIKNALNQFYFMLSDSGFFSECILNHFPTCLSLMRVLSVIVEGFEKNDSHRKQIISLGRMMDGVVNSHESARSFVSAIYQPVFDFIETPDEINLDEILRYSQDWLSRTDMIGLDTVLVNKNNFLLMLDRAVWYLSETRRGPQIAYKVNLLQSIRQLREKIIYSKFGDGLKKFLYQIIKLSDEFFLSIFFRQLILHCYIELKLGQAIQHLIAVKEFDEKMVHDKIRALLSVSITDSTIKEFCNKILVIYEPLAQEVGWSRIDIHSAIAPASLSHASFFGSGNVGRVVVNSTESLLSTATTLAESDSARVMVDSLRSIAGSTSNTALAAATSAKAAVSSTSELISAWWKRG